MTELLTGGDGGAEPPEIADPAAAQHGAPGGAQEPPERPEPAPEPDGGPEEPKPLKPVDDTKAHYVVLVAAKPGRGEGRPRYVEVGIYPGSTPQVAKDRANADSEWMREQIASRRGAFVRAVPAMHWPADVEASTVEREPVFRIR